MKPPLSATVNEHNAHPVYRPDIDGLRAVAILSVVFFHAFPARLQGGFVGVDIFFVISGFLISTIIFRSLDRGDFSFYEFYAHRAKRIFPALIVVLIACYALGWFVLLPNEFEQLGKHIAGGAGFVQNIVLWSEAGYFDAAAEIKPLLHLWSLAIEEQYYLFFPALVFLVWRAGLNILTIVLLLGGLSLGINVSEVETDPVATFFMPQTRVWELLAGSVLAYFQLFKKVQLASFLKRWMSHSNLFRQPLRSNHHDNVLNNLISSIGLILIAVAIAGINKEKSFPGWWALIPVAGAFLTIFAGPQAWINRTILSNKLMVFVGIISYPLYLWHWPVLVFARIIELETPSREIRIGAVCLSFVLAWVTYRLIEKPIRFGGGAWIKTAVLSVLLAVMGFIGYNTYQRNGLPFRIPDEVRHIADFKYEFAKDARAGKCWLSREQAPDDFKNECTAANLIKNNSVLIWGDSHAARLYPGLHAALGEEVALSQFTRDSCPPLLGYGYVVCQKSNDYVISIIQKIAPTTVVMFAVWDGYEDDWSGDSTARKGLQKTMKQLQKMGVKNIVVLGPAPSWKDALPKLVYKAWKDSFPHAIPERLSTGMNAKTWSVDKQLEGLIISENVNYISVLQLTCDIGGCLTHMPGYPAKLLTWDYGHLTTDGAILLSQKLLKSGVFP